MENYLKDLFKADEALDATLKLNEDLIRSCVNEIKQDENIKNGFLKFECSNEHGAILKAALEKIGYHVKTIFTKLECYDGSDIVIDSYIKITWI